MLVQIRSLAYRLTQQEIGFNDLRRFGEGGHLFILGRKKTLKKKDIINFPSGKNVFPGDVEEYYDRTPFISEVRLLGVGDESNPFAHAEKLLVIIRPDFDHLKAQHVRINLVMVT